jgi:hypothetical protein
MKGIGCSSLEMCEMKSWPKEEKKEKEKSE